MDCLLNQMVHMRDGILLATDIYFPSAKGPWPVIIERTPYGKTNQSRSEIDIQGREISRREMAQKFTAKGFVMIFQDCRGRYDSEGEFVKYVNEANDGFDTYLWIVDQVWSDGRIGSMGLSYAAHTQLAAAGLNPPGLKAMVLDSGGFDNAYRWGIRQGGAFELKQATWAYKQSRSEEEFDSNEIMEWFQRMPWAEGASPLAPGSSFEEYLLDQWRHGTFDDFWKHPGMYNEPFYNDVPDIPILFMSSWFDVYVPSTIHNYTALNGNQLIMGPWLHGDRNSITSGDVIFGNSASFDGNVGTSWLDYRISWFESIFMKDAVEKPCVKIFEMGGGIGKWQSEIHHGGEWKSFETWPPLDVTSRKWYLGADCSLLDAANPGESILFSDPSNPVPTLGGQATSGKPVFVGGSFEQVEAPQFFGASGDYRPLIERDDVLYFETEILEDDVVIAGEIEVGITFIADGNDFDIAAKLVDVYPDGTAINISDSIQRARYRHSYEKPTLAKPGVKDRLSVELPQTCNRFVKGHRIRLMISGSNFPHFDVNPNSGEPEGYANHARKAYTTIVLDESYLRADVRGLSRA